MGYRRAGLSNNKLDTFFAHSFRVFSRLKMLWSRRWFRIVAEVLLLLTVLFALRFYTQRDMISGSVPLLQGQMLDGGNYRFPPVPHKPILVHFWASWCPVCRLEEDAVQAISEDHPVITIAMQSGDSEEVKGFMREHGLSFPVLNDPDGVLAGRFGVKAVPSSFVIDADNQIAFRETGYTTEWGLRLRLWLAE